ncbi:uncharacterized protein LOC111640997 [Centruroides sculpturatus]|uniref:uncharacterized protein LOC111640997 n=1 Tax=Centruroides sculpturatus TaxID=218467 RepID=UPI000C6EAEDE|nr:uncharacterized protein LOC111640997 [Centruroides sculpturatus]
MASILSTSNLPKILLAISQLINITLFGLIISILIHPLLIYYLDANGKYGKADFCCYAFLASLYIAIAFVIVSLIHTICGIIGSIECNKIKNSMLFGFALLIILNLSAIISIAVENDLMNEKQLSDVTHEEINNYIFFNHSIFLDTLHTQFDCCGVSGWKDFVIETENLTPKSCREPHLNTGCITDLTSFIKTKRNVLVSFYVLFIIFQIISLISVLYPGFKLKRKTKSENNELQNQTNNS